MLFPSKLINYEDSVLYGLSLILEKLEKGPQSVEALFSSSVIIINDVSRFIEILDCLFALGAIEFDGEKKVLKYVERDRL